jgi:hypothetical protein
MSPLEQDIRDSLRAEAERLSELRPLRLPPAAARPRRWRAPRAAGPRWQRPWQAPLLAAMVIVLVAATLVAVKVLRNGSVVPPASPGPVPASSAGPTPAVTPRYYLRFGWATTPAGNPTGIATMVGDAQTGKTLGSFSVPNGETYDWAASGAADDRTFVVFAGVRRSIQDLVPASAKFYLVRIFPGSAHPVRATPLAIQDTLVTAPATLVASIALSADGSELAVVYNTSKSVGLGVYSMATGRRQHFWSAALNAGLRPRWEALVTNPSWVGDETVAFAYIQTPKVRQEVRTLDVNSAGTGLLTDSHVVWSQYVPAPAGGKYGKGTPQTCQTPILAGDGQAVVCATSSYSASDKRLSALWLAYPLGPPARPRVIGRVLVPPNVQGFNGPNSVDWTNSTGTEVVGSWNPEVITSSPGNTAFNGARDVSTSVTNNTAFIGAGQVRPFPWDHGEQVTW